MSVEIGERVCFIRQARGMTQESVAIHMASRGFETWRRQTVIRTERGERSLKLAEAVELADLLGVTVRWLALGNEPIDAMMTTSEDVKDVPSSEEEPHGRPGT